MKKLEEIEFKSAGVESESSIANLESQIGVSTPKCLRNHLLRYGGGYITDCQIPCKMPTPFGELNIVEIATIEGMLSMIHSEIIPRNMLFCGIGHAGKLTCISIAGLDHGKVYAFDSEMRYYWDQEEIDARPALDPLIVEFFRLRDNDELPERPWGYENCYEVADNFDEFLENLEVYG